MPVIASTSRGAYFPAMIAILFRLLALVAVMVMPLGMSPVAAAMHQPAASSAGTMDHCADHDGQPRHKSASADECAGCVAVAAVTPPATAHEDAPAIVPYRALADFRLGLNLEIATPPPKRS